MSDSEGDDYVYYGTALVQENALPVYSAKKSDESATKSLPVHKQQVRDEQGRQRLHGAFTGGYSAGFFNSVGSVEGFTPASFRSSRSDRKAPVGQHIADFLDEDEKADLERTSLRTTSEYDTFGSAATAAVTAEAQREEERSEARGTGVPLLLPQEVLKPVANSIGVQLLQKMGWRPGKGLGTRESAGLSRMGIAVPGAEAEDDGAGSGRRRRRWGPEASLLADATPLYLLAPKEDLYGLGYDPYANAEEFREARKRSRAHEASERQPPGAKRQRGVAFAPSVIEETDVYGGELADYTADADPHAGYLNEIVSEDDEDDALRLSGPSQGRLGGSAPVAAIKARQGTMGNDSFIEGFVRADIEAPASVHSGPELPVGYRQPPHVFGKPCPLLYGALRASDDPARDSAKLPPVEPPSDPALKQKIDALAAYVARAGIGGQELALKQHADDQDYDFLHGGRGAAYYAYRLAAIKRALRVAGVGNVEAEPANARGRPAPLSVEQRATLLGEAQLPGTSCSNAPLAPSTQPAPQAVAPAPGAHAVERGTGLLSRMAAKDIAAVSASFNSRFVKAETLAPAQGGWTTARQEQAKAPAADTAELPAVRTQEDWVPEALLCRRFNVPEPYKGRAAKLQRPRDSIDYLALPETERAAAYAQSLPAFLKPPPSDTLPLPPPRQASTDRAMLPPPPSRPSAAAAAAGIGSAAAAAPSAAAAELDPAEALLAGMEAAGELGVVQPPHEEGTAALDDETVELLNVEKPLDLFKAIFENSDAEGSDGEAGDAVGADSRAGAAGAELSTATPDVPEAAVERVAAQGSAASDRGGGFQTDLGAALLKAQSLMAQRAAEARAGGDMSGAARSLADASKSVGTSLGAEGGLRGDAGGYATDSSSTSEAGSLSPSDRRHVQDAGGRAAATGAGEPRPLGARGDAPALDKAQRRAERERKREELLEQALLTVRDGVARQALSVKEIDGIMKALKKDKKHKRDKKKRKSKDRDKKAKKSKRHAD